MFGILKKNKSSDIKSPCLSKLKNDFFSSWRGKLYHCCETEPGADGDNMTNLICSEASLS